MGKCPSCKGFGTLPDGSTCGDCWGSGRDWDHRLHLWYWFSHMAYRSYHSLCGC